MLRFGTISKVNAAKGLAKVNFAEDEMESFWLPIVNKGSLKNKDYSIPDVGEHVVCLMDEHAENGAILGAIYNTKDTPGYSSQDKVGVKFDSGDEIVYDRSARKWRVKTNNGLIEVSDSGPTLKKGSESLKQILLDLLDQILVETHPTPAGPSSVPTNSAAYTAIKSRINDFFES